MPIAPLNRYCRGHEITRWQHMERVENHRCAACPQGPHAARIVGRGVERERAIHRVAEAKARMVRKLRRHREQPSLLLTPAPSHLATPTPITGNATNLCRNPRERVRSEIHERSLKSECHDSTTEQSQKPSPTLLDNSTIVWRWTTSLDKTTVRKNKLVTSA